MKILSIVKWVTKYCVYSVVLFYASFTYASIEDWWINAIFGLFTGIPWTWVICELFFSRYKEGSSEDSEQELEECWFQELGSSEQDSVPVDFIFLRSWILFADSKSFVFLQSSPLWLFSSTSIFFFLVRSIALIFLFGSKVAFFALMIRSRAYAEHLLGSQVFFNRQCGHVNSLCQFWCGCNIGFGSCFNFGLLFVLGFYCIQWVMNKIIYIFFKVFLWKIWDSLIEILW